MKYGFILAGGKGERMKNSGIPKQFLTISDKPIIIHTLEKLLEFDLLDKIIIVCNEKYIDYLKDMLYEYNLLQKVEITNGGKNRLNSVLNGIKFVKEHYGINNDDIFLAHDSVRMFVSKRIIKENIEKACETGAATTVYPIEETIVKTNQNNVLNTAYKRDKMFSDQSPQSYNIKKYIECTNNIQESVLDTFTDLSENLFYNNEVVYPVIGEKQNIKITTPFDLVLAEALLNSNNSKINN